MLKAKDIKSLYKINKSLALKVAKVLGYIIQVKAADISKFSNWVRPTNEQIKQEYEWEYISHIKDRWPLFKNLKDFSNSVKNAKVMTLTKSIDQKVSNRSDTKNLDELKNLVSKYRFPRDVDRIVDGFKTNAKMPMPFLLRLAKDKLYIMSGNTRTDVAFILGITPKVLILDVANRI